MTNQSRTLMVEQLPEKLDRKERRNFLHRMTRCMSPDRPWVVLDCSRMRQPDRHVINVLLCCLEEAIKRNGDIKLAGVVPEAKQILHRLGVDRVFEIHQTTLDAVNSFCQPATLWVQKNHGTA